MTPALPATWYLYASSPLDGQAWGRVCALSGKPNAVGSNGIHGNWGTHERQVRCSLSALGAGRQCRSGCRLGAARLSAYGHERPLAEPCSSWRRHRLRRGPRGSALSSTPRREAGESGRHRPLPCGSVAQAAAWGAHQAASAQAWRSTTARRCRCPVHEGLTLMKLGSLLIRFRPTLDPVPIRFRPGMDPRGPTCDPLAIRFRPACFDVGSAPSTWSGGICPRIPRPEGVGSGQYWVYR
ncbi:hypothetical protein ROSA5918_04530 [Roseateles saccharophilus]|uniref:Uncharacterized protein n=1 Tax=Roseateles saccharophilus TaxID=304 RepID=A0A4R3VJH3_ROSSA|nr:hypothetical protein EV671_1002254 [Roseateles saccharophilus]